MTGETAFAEDFLSSVVATFRGQKDLADRAIRQLDFPTLRRRLDADTNSPAVIMKHIAGNLLSRWTEFLSTDGEKPWRDRDREFIDDFTSREELMSFWERGWSCLFETLSALRPTGLSQSVTIRGEPHTVARAILRSVDHTGYHVGQIVMVCRILAGDNWEVLTIPRGQSARYNQANWNTNT